MLQHLSLQINYLQLEFNPVRLGKQLKLNISYIKYIQGVLQTFNVANSQEIGNISSSRGRDIQIFRS